MRILVAGATGAVGRRLVKRLVQAGHSVAGTTRTAAKQDIIRGLGAEPIIADGLDRSAVQRAVDAAKPDVIVHEMTALAGLSDLSRFDRAFATTNRLRTEGTDHLLAAAREAGVRRIVAQSYCGWPYARTGGPVKSEADPLDPTPFARQRQSLAAIRHLETAVTQASGITGIALRYGAFYGPGTGMLYPAVLQQLRQRRFPLIGDGAGWWSFVHVDDAAEATRLAAERGSSGVYNIVDDEPAQARDWLPVLASLAGGKPPLRVPRWLAALLAGPHVAAMMTEARAGSNAKAKAELGWRPAYPSWRQGFAEALRAGTTAAAA